MLIWTHQKERRWYAVDMTADIFGQLVVIKEWGSLDTDRGGRMVIPCDSVESAEKLMDAIAARRMARGYVACLCVS